MEEEDFGEAMQENSTGHHSPFLGSNGKERSSQTPPCAFFRAI
jgi:hypothetical protein